MKSLFKEQLHQTFKLHRWFLHLLFWMVFITFFYFTTRNQGAYDSEKFPAKYAALLFIAAMSVILIQSYVYVLLIVPLYNLRKKIIFWISFIGNLTFFYTLNVSLCRLIIMEVPAISAHPGASWMSLATKNIMPYLFISGIFMAFYYFVDIYDRQKEIQRLEQFKTQKIALESSFLKSQVNPHFLFNTLNNIYALSLKKSAQTPVIIDRLESLLHYMLYECKADLVPLVNEFNFTNSYIALEKLRHKEDQCKVTIKINGNPDNKQIAPLLLINFLENAFKHGTKTSFGKSWIDMQIDITDKVFYFRLRNSKPSKTGSQPIAEYKGGIGLKNVQRRLEILYPRRYELNITNTTEQFGVFLSINF